MPILLLLLCNHKGLGLVRLDVFLCLMQEMYVDGQGRRRCLSVVSEPFGQEHKVEIIPLLVLPLITNSSNFLEAGPRGVGTAKREGSNALWQKAFNKHF